MRRLPIYAVLAWAGHLFAFIAVARFDWDGFKLAACIDLPYQFLLFRWLWKEYRAAWRRRNKMPGWTARQETASGTWRVERGDRIRRVSRRWS